MSDERRIVQFLFVRLDPRFLTLQSNEKLVARQEFLASFEPVQKRSPAVVYSLSGLRADCDALFVRAAEDLETLQQAADRVRASGLGRYLAPAHSFLGAGAEPPAGQARYLFVCPCARTPAWYGLEPGRRRARAAEWLSVVRERPALKSYAFDSLGAGGPGAVFAFETERPRDFLDALEDYGASESARYLAPGEAFPGVRREIHDLVEAFG